MPLGDEYKADNSTLLRTQERFHNACVLCGSENSAGLKLKFKVEADGSVSAEFMCPAAFQGYKGCLHGGIIAAVLDSAMTNCLFAREIAALTAELSVKYRTPVICGRQALVRAWIEKSYAPLHNLKAEILQDGRTVATAESKFIENRDLR